MRFAHPVEAELARLFDANGIRWEYEPHLFVLERSRDGRITEAFVPDFFLPDLDVYVECTVMKQSLTSRKARKVRAACARYGAIVVLLYRRDLERLQAKYGLRLDLSA